MTLIGPDHLVLELSKLLLEKLPVFPGSAEFNGNGIFPRLEGSRPEIVLKLLCKQGRGGKLVREIGSPNLKIEYLFKPGGLGSTIPAIRRANGNPGFRLPDCLAQRTGLSVKVVALKGRELLRPRRGLAGGVCCRIRRSCVRTHKAFVKFKKLVNPVCLSARKKVALLYPCNPGLLLAKGKPRLVE